MSKAELKVSDPVAEAKSPFLSAEQAIKEAREGFRFQVEHLLTQTIKAGMRKLELNVTEVAPEFREELISELQGLGYTTKLGTHIKNAESSKVLTVSF